MTDNAENKEQVDTATLQQEMANKVMVPLPKGHARVVLVVDIEQNDAKTAKKSGGIAILHEDDAEPLAMAAAHSLGHILHVIDRGFDCPSKNEMLGAMLTEFAYKTKNAVEGKTPDAVAEEVSK